MRRAIWLRSLVILLVAAAVLAVADNVRPWRQYQVEFFERELDQVNAELASVRSQPDEQAADLQAAMIAADEKVAARADEILETERELEDLRAKLAAAERRQTALGNRLEQARYRVRQSPSDPEADPSEIQDLERQQLETRKEIEEIREFVDVREQRLEDHRSEARTARERWRLHTSEATRLEERRQELERGAWWRRLPVAGLFHPSLGIREVAVDAVASEARVDRCVTCHLGAQRPGFEGEGWPLVLRSHPRLDLFLSESSPHPYQQFGCTVCHGGEGRATGFELAGHPTASSPSTDRPIFPRGLFEAGCIRCHEGRDELPAAPVAAAGSRLVRQMGCSGCHQVPRPTSTLAQAGPALDGIAAKTNPAWAFRWLAAPRAFRPSTWMPHFFDLDSDSDRERQIAEIRAIVVYLWEKSRGPAYRGPALDEAPAGDPESGRVLFESVGCRACHLTDADALRDESYPAYERLHGPNLARTGDKVAASWLYAWLRDPQAYRHDTPMPSLRLSGREAADLTAYLMTLRDSAPDVTEPPSASTETRDELVLAYLRQDNTIEGSEVLFEGMTERERNLYLGERSIARYGCHGCHRIPGFEEAPPLDGGDLTALGGPRSLRFLEAGHAGMDDGRLLEAPPSPDYGWSRRESEAVVTTLLGWQGSSSNRSDADAPSGIASVIGRAVLDHYGCRACHRIDRHVAEPEPELGPDLTLVGAKLQSSWLHEYLRDPGEVPVRPWQTARMPTFHWTDSELDAVVRYFADRAGVELFTSDPPPPSRRDLAMGGAVFRTLQCDRCHIGSSSQSDIPVPQFAPTYKLARQRLRPDWVVDWVLEPRRWDPDTRMPASFVSAFGDEPDASFLAASLATPFFRVDQDRLLRVFDNEAEIEAYFDDPRQVAAAVRDHLWALGD